MGDIFVRRARHSERGARDGLRDGRPARRAHAAGNRDTWRWSERRGDLDSAEAFEMDDDAEIARAERASEAANALYERLEPITDGWSDDRERATVRLIRAMPAPGSPLLSPERSTIAALMPSTEVACGWRGTRGAGRDASAVPFLASSDASSSRAPNSRSTGASPKLERGGWRNRAAQTASNAARRNRRRARRRLHRRGRSIPTPPPSPRRTRPSGRSPPCRRAAGGAPSRAG